MGPVGRVERVGRVGVGLFLFFQGLYALTSSGNTFRIPDEFEVYFQTEHLVDAGDLSVPQTGALRQGGAPIFFGRVGADGKPYAPYGPLAAILAVPHHLLGRAVASLAGVPRAPLGRGMAWMLLVGGFTMLASSTAAALAVVGFHRAALALDTPARTALQLSLLLGGATVVWTYGTTLYSEAWQAAAFVWAAALLLEARRGHSRGAAMIVVASLLVAAAGLTKVTSLVFAPAFVVGAAVDRSVPLRTRLQVASALAAGIALATLVHIGWNVHRFGLPFEFGYDWSETVPQLPAVAFFAPDLPHGLSALLFSPGKSILLWAPPLALALFGSALFMRREPAVSIGIGTAFAVGLVFFGAYLFPEGGYAHGPRNLVPIVPLLLLFAAGPDERYWPRALITLVAAAGIAVTALSVSVSFFEDQALGPGPGGQARTHYYALVDPPPGRAANRYQLSYVPFVTALRTPGWVSTPNLGQGPDFLPRLLLQARRALPDGAAIPAWLVWLVPLLSLALLAAGGRTLGAAWRALSAAGEPPSAA